MNLEAPASTKENCSLALSFLPPSSDSGCWIPSPGSVIDLVAKRYRFIHSRVFTETPLQRLFCVLGDSEAETMVRFLFSVSYALLNAAPWTRLFPFRIYLWHIFRLQL